ncbi:MAG: hypothetical protein ABIW50_00705 [Candidatus Limnocylindria bacterium]
MSWATFSADAPELAEAGRALIHREAIGQAFLVTIRDSSTPRIHPVYVAVRDGRLVTFADGAKRADLETDGRYALHTHIDSDQPSEFSVRGLARAVEGPLRDELVADWYFDAGSAYGVFELLVERAVFGQRPDSDAWPPVYQSWKAGPSTT